MAILDIFNEDAFGLVSMSKAVQKRPFVPQGLAAMGIFQTQRIRTESIAIEYGNSKLKLIQTSRRGDPIEQLGKRKQTIKSYATSRIAEGSRIMASELDFLRSMNQEQGMVTLAQELANRLGHGDNIGILDDVELTMENMRLGAVQGKVLDADGSIITDWTSEFHNSTDNGGTGTRKTVVWDLAPAKDGGFRRQCNEVRREIIKGSGGTFKQNSKIINLCSAGFYDTLIEMKEVRESYRNQENAYYVKGGDVFDSFEYPSGMVWKDYRGTDEMTGANSVNIPTDECVTFPSKTQGGFLEVFAHGETFEDNGTLGQRYYAKTVRDREDTYVDIKGLSYPLLVCTIPESLRRGTIKQ